MNKQVSYAYQHLSRTETLFKGENKNINISVSKNSPVNASLSLDCIFRKNCASVPEERSAIPLETEQSSAD